MTESTLLRRGDIVDGKYRVEELLGAGGMGVVLSATHLELRTKVAIKFLLQRAEKNEAAATRLVREARATARIQSEHVARIIDVGTTDPSSPYIVMDLLEGENLAELLQANKRLPIAEAVTYMLEACDGIAEAHAVGIVHRDLKPSNIFLARRRDGRTTIKVLDFGLSKIIDRAEFLSRGARLTGTTDVFGSPVYMSPEQLESSRDVDGRTDIWALGVILFELLTGRRPFEGRSLPQLCMLISHGKPQSVRRFDPEIPIELDAVIERCLVKDPAKRFATVSELMSALRPFVAREQLSPVNARGESVAPGKTPPVDAVAVAEIAAPGRPEPMRPVAAASPTRPVATPEPMRPVAAAGAFEPIRLPKPRIPRATRAPRGWARPRVAMWLAIGVACALAGALVLVPRFHGAKPGIAPPATVAHVVPIASCGNLGTTPCSSCIAASCCGEYQACRGVPACQLALERYNGCMHHAEGDRAATCSEQFGTDPNLEARALAGCAFVHVGGPVVTPGRCADKCERDFIGDNACVAYCNCMALTCQSTMDPVECPSACARLSSQQIECRTYHCFLASQGHPEIHCEHSIGHLGMCP